MIVGFRDKIKFWHAVKLNRVKQTKQVQQRKKSFKWLFIEMENKTLFIFQKTWIKRVSIQISFF
jgi:hypothetical protein